MQQPLSQNFSLSGANILITGASSGLGREFAYQVAPEAGMLILVARRHSLLKELYEELKKLYPDLSIELYQADLALESERLALADWMCEQKIPLHFLINNAGLGDFDFFADSSWEKIRQMLRVNIEALTHLTHLFLPLLRQYAPSALLQVGSVLGFVPMPQKSIYAATKAYVRSFTEALRIEEKQYGVSVSLLTPGPVPTEFFHVATQKTASPKNRECSNSQALNIMKMVPNCFITSAKEVVAHALKGVVRHDVCIIPNSTLRFFIFLIMIVPFKILRFILSRQIQLSSTTLPKT